MSQNRFVSGAFGLAAQSFRSHRINVPLFVSAQIVATQPVLIQCPNWK